MYFNKTKLFLGFDTLFELIIAYVLEYMYFK